MCVAPYTYQLLPRNLTFKSHSSPICSLQSVSTGFHIHPAPDLPMLSICGDSADCIYYIDNLESITVGHVTRKPLSSLFSNPSKLIGSPGWNFTDSCL